MLHHSFLNKKIQMKGLISKGNAFAIFSHPDFTALAFSPEQERASLPCRLANSAPPNSTVGSGISPDRPFSGSQTFTAGMEFHQSPKISRMPRRRFGHGASVFMKRN
jgi:hypothetical protein